MDEINYSQDQKANKEDKNEKAVPRLDPNIDNLHLDDSKVNTDEQPEKTADGKPEEAQQNEPENDKTQKADKNLQTSSGWGKDDTKESDSTYRAISRTNQASDQLRASEELNTETVESKESENLEWTTNTDNNSDAQPIGSNSKEIISWENGSGQGSQQEDRDSQNNQNGFEEQKTNDKKDQDRHNMFVKEGLKPKLNNTDDVNTSTNDDKYNKEEKQEINFSDSSEDIIELKLKLRPVAANTPNAEIGSDNKEGNAQNQTQRRWNSLEVLEQSIQVVRSRAYRREGSNSRPATEEKATQIAEPPKTTEGEVSEDKKPINHTRRRSSSVPREGRTYKMYRREKRKRGNSTSTDATVTTSSESKPPVEVKDANQGGAMNRTETEIVTTQENSREFSV